MKPYAKQNHAGGYDLLTERNSGNEVRIQTGYVGSSVEYWTNLRNLCNEVLAQLSITEEADREFLVESEE